MSKGNLFFGVVIVILLVIGIIVTSYVYDNQLASEEPVVTTPMPEPFVGTVKIRYEYGQLPTWMRAELPDPSDVDVEVSFDPKEGWSPIDFHLREWKGVELFALRLNSGTSGIYFGGCLWKYVGRSADDDTVYRSTYRFYECTEVAPETVIPVKQHMAYCEVYGSGLLCEKQGLTLYLDLVSDSVSFTSTGEFLPQYRIWVEQTLNYFEYVEYGELPEVLEPNRNYTISGDRAE